MAETLETDKDFFKRGLDYHNKGDFHKAISMYKKSMETYGVDKKTLVLLGNTYYMTKNFKEAKKLYKKALALDPNYSKAYFNLGIVYDGANNFELAIKAYKKTIELDNNFAEAYANLGDVYKSLQDMDRAVLNYLKALEIDSENENAKEGLKHIPDYLLEKVKDRDLMNRSDKLLRQGISDEKKGNISGARKKYEKALKIFPRSAAGLFLLKLLPDAPKLQVLSKKEIAFTNQKSRIIAESISPEVREFLGRKLGNIELEAKSLEHFFKAFKEKITKQKGQTIDLSQMNRSILFEEPERDLNHAVKSAIKGKDEEAEKEFEEIQKRAPYLLHARYVAGLFYELRENEEAAFSIYKKAQKYNLKYMDGRPIQGISKLFAGILGLEYLREVDIISLLRDFLETTQKEEPVSLLRFIKYKLSLEAEDKLKYGFEKEESGESKEAISAYEDAVSIDPNNPLSLYVLGLAYESRGLEKEAMSTYVKTKGADFQGLESSEAVSKIIEEYLGKTTSDGTRVGAILSRYFEIIAEDPEHMLELLRFIEDLKIESISKIIKSHISSDLILESGEKIGGEKPHSGFGETGAGLEGKVVRDKSDFGEDLDEEENKITRAREISKINFKLLWKYKTQRSIRSVSCSTDGKKVLASSENGFVYFIQKNAQSPWRHQSGSSIVNMDLSSEGKYVVFCGSKNIVELLDCRDEGKSLWKIDMSGKWVNSVAISSNAKIIAVSNNDFQVVFLDRDGHLKQSLDMDKIIKVIDITDSGTKLLGASKESLFLIRKSGSKLLKEFHGKDIQCISISKKGKFIAVGTESGSVYLLDGEGRSLWKKNISTPVYGVSVSDDGRVVSGGMNGTIVLNSSKGEQLWKYHTGESVWDLDISKNGDRIIAGCGLVTGHVYHFIMGQTQES